MKISLFVLLGSCVNLAFASSGLSGLTYMSPKGKNAKWNKLPIKLCASQALPSKIKEQLRIAAEVWNKTLKQKVFDVNCQTTNPNHVEEDSTNHGVYWLASGFENHTDKTSLARTYVHYDDEGNIVDSDIVLNGQYYDWIKLPIDAQTVFIHELGHVLGLKHFFLSLNSAMNYYPYIAGYRHRTLGEYEKLVFQSIYKGEANTIPEYLKLYFSDLPNEAIKALEKMPQKSSEIHYALAALYKSLKLPQASLIHFSKVLEQSPKLAFVRQQYADALWSTGDVAAAKREFLKTIEDDSRNYEAMVNLGVLELKQGDKKKGLFYLKKALDVQPAHWMACQILYEQTHEQKYQLCRLKFGPG